MYFNVFNVFNVFKEKKLVKYNIIKFRIFKINC
jgi:hypothetical protein